MVVYQAGKYVKDNLKTTKLRFHTAGAANASIAEHVLARRFKVLEEASAADNGPRSDYKKWNLTVEDGVL